MLELESTSTPLPMLDLDNDMIRRVLINLAENAVKYRAVSGRETHIGPGFGDDVPVKPEIRCWRGQARNQQTSSDPSRVFGL